MSSAVKPSGELYGHKWQILIAVMMGTVMGPLDGSIVNTILPAITKYFRTEIAIVQWVPTIYLLTISCLILLYGRLGDMIGYKKIFLLGLASFAASSILCGLSQSIWMLIAFRALQGLAAGMMMAVSFAIITASFPPKERGTALGTGAIAISAGLAIGPSLGGIITQYLTWRYVFFINVPIGLTALFWGYRIIPRSEVKPGQRLDIKGALTAFIFLSAILLYANRAERWGWTEPHSLFLLGLALVFFVFFLFLESRTAFPMLNLKLFSNRTFSFANLSAMLSFMALFAMVFLTPFYLVFVLKYKMLKVGLVLAATPLATMFVAPVSGRISDRIGTRGLAFFGMCACSLGLFFLSRLGMEAQSTDVIWRIIIVGVGTGMFQSPNNSTVMGSVPPAYLGISSGILAAMRNVGMVFGIAFAGAVLYKIAPVALYQNPGSFNEEQLATFLKGLQWAYLTGAVLAAASALTSLLAISRGKSN